MADVDGSVVSTLGPVSGGDGALSRGSADGSPVNLGVSKGGTSYHMRGYDQNLEWFVYWQSSVVDASAVDYGGPGPVVDVVVQSATVVKTP